MERQAISQTSRRSKLNWAFRLLGGLLRLAAFLTMLGAWAVTFSTTNRTFLYGALAATILYLLLWALTFLSSRRFRQAFDEAQPIRYLLDGLPLWIAIISLVLGFTYFSGQQQALYIAILVGTGILLCLGISIGAGIDKRSPDATELLEGCGGCCLEGCFEALLGGLHI